MPIGDGKVAARDTRVLGTQCRVWTPIVAEAGRALAAIHAVTPITGAEPHVAFGENKLDILLHVAVAGATAERAACRDLVTAFASKTCGGEKLFEGCARFLHRLRIDQLGEIEVGTHIGAVRHDAADMAVVGLQGVQAGAVPATDETGKGLATLVRGEMPWAPVALRRQADERGEMAVQADGHGSDRWHLNRSALDYPVSRHHQPQLGPSGTASQRLGQALKNFDGTYHRCRC